MDRNLFNYKMEDEEEYNPFDHTLSGVNSQLMNVISPKPYHYYVTNQ